MEIIIPEMFGEGEMLNEAAALCCLIRFACSSRINKVLLRYNLFLGSTKNERQIRSENHCFFSSEIRLEETVRAF